MIKNKKDGTEPEKQDRNLLDRIKIKIIENKVVIFLAFITLMLIIGVALLFLKNDWNLGKLSEYFNIVMTPVTLAALFVAFNEYKENKKSNDIQEKNDFEIKEIELKNKDNQIILDKFDRTKRFVEEFVEILNQAEFLSDIKSVYYQSDEKISKLLTLIKEKNILLLTEREFIGLLEAADLTLEEVKDFNQVSKSDYTIEHDETLSNYIDICAQFQNHYFFTRKNSFSEEYRVYVELRDALTEDYEMMTEEAVEKIKEENPYNFADPVSQIKAQHKQTYNENIYELKRHFAGNIREQDGAVLNNLETICLASKFDTLDMEPLYNLIISPFEHFINIFYIDIMLTIIRGYESGYIYLSNIVYFNNELMKIKDNLLSGENELLNKQKKFEKERDQAREAQTSMGAKSLE